MAAFIIERPSARGQHHQRNGIDDIEARGYHNKMIHDDISNAYHFDIEYRQHADAACCAAALFRI